MNKYRWEEYLGYLYPVEYLYDEDKRVGSVQYQSQNPVGFRGYLSGTNMTTDVLCKSEAKNALITIYKDNKKEKE